MVATARTLTTRPKCPVSVVGNCEPGSSYIQTACLNCGGAVVRWLVISGVYYPVRMHVLPGY